MPDETLSTSRPLFAEAPTFTEVKTIKVPRTIYDASAAEVFFKNFLAGVGHGLGGVFVYFLFVLFMLYLAARFVWPVVQPYVNMYQQSMQSLQKMQHLIPGSGNDQSATGWNIQLNSDQLKNILPKVQPLERPQ